MSKPLNESIRDDLVRIFKEDEQVVTEATRPIAKIDSEQYLNWFYNDDEDKDLLAKKVINILKLHGKITMSLDDVLKNTQYIPTQLIMNYEEVKSQLPQETLETAEKENEIYDPSQVFDVNWIR